MIKLKNFVPLLILSLFFTSVTIIIGQLSYANNGRRFYCKINAQSIPVTYGDSSANKPKAIIKWQSNYFGKEWTPKKRCEVVSDRFQAFNDNGMLQYIKSGKINNYPVICAATDMWDNCRDDNVLFTLAQGSNAKQVAQQLMNTRGLAAGNIILQSTDEDAVLINFENYWNEALPE